MTRLGHPLAEDMTVFNFDPAVHIELEYTVADDFFLVEDIDMGSHTGTHLDVPAHFIEGGRTVDELAAEEFVWPAYKMDVRGMTFADNFVEVDDILAYEDEHGPIPSDGALVVLQTGAEAFWGAEVVAQDADDNAAKYVVEAYFKDADVPFVFCGVNWTADEYGFPYSNVTGIVEVAPIGPMLEEAVEMTGGARATYIGAATLTEKKNLARFEQAAAELGIELEHAFVQRSLRRAIHAGERLGNLVIDVADRAKHTLAQVTCGITVAQLQRLPRPG